MSDLTDTLTAALKQWQETGDIEVPADEAPTEEAPAEDSAPAEQEGGHAAAPPPEPAPDTDLPLSEFGITDDTDDTAPEPEVTAEQMADMIDEAGGDPDELPPFDITRFMELSLGRELSPEDAQQMAQTYAWAQSLTPEQVARVEAALANDQPIAPHADTAPAARPVATPDLPRLDLGEFVEPETAQQIQQYVAQAIEAGTAPLQEQLSQYQQRALEAERARVQAEQGRIAEEIGQGSTAFREAHPELTQEELAALEMRVRQANTLSSLYQTNGGDARKAAADALEMALMSDASLRAKAVHALAAKERDQQEEDAQRVQDISALAGSGGGSAAPADTMSTGEPDSLEGAIRKIMSQG